MRIFCFSPFGYEGNLVTVEVDLRRGIPAVDIVGLADNAVKESRERMKSAIINSGLLFPPERVLISLSPADLKRGSRLRSCDCSCSFIGKRKFRKRRFCISNGTYSCDWRT